MKNYWLQQVLNTRSRVFFNKYSTVKEHFKKNTFCNKNLKINTKKTPGLKIESQMSIYYCMNKCIHTRRLVRIYFSELRVWYSGVLQEQINDRFQFQQQYYWYLNIFVKVCKWNQSDYIFLVWACFSLTVFLVKKNNINFIFNGKLFPFTAPKTLEAIISLDMNFRPKKRYSNHREDLGYRQRGKLWFIWFHYMGKLSLGTLSKFEKKNQLTGEKLSSRV